MRNAFARTALEVLDEDPLAAVVLADISADLFEPLPDRVFNVGIREPLMVSVAGGMALSGMRPIAHTYAPFLVDRSFEQLKLDLTHQGVRLPVVSVGASYDTSQGGRTHHSPMDVALVDTLPGWTVHVPGHADEVPNMIRGALGRSAYVRLAASTNTEPRPSAADGSLDVVKQGQQALVIAVGPTLDNVLDATRDLDVTVAYATTVRPLDDVGLRSLAVNDTVILVEPYLRGTSSRLVDEALADRPHRTIGLGVTRDDPRTYGSIADLDALQGLDPAGLRRSIQAAL